MSLSLRAVLLSDSLVRDRFRDPRPGTEADDRDIPGRPSGSSRFIGVRIAWRFEEGISPLAGSVEMTWVELHQRRGQRLRRGQGQWPGNGNGNGNGLGHGKGDRYTAPHVAGSAG
jgi:hypothetical protein